MQKKLNVRESLLSWMEWHYFKRQKYSSIHCHFSLKMSFLFYLSTTQNHSSARNKNEGGKSNKNQEIGKPIFRTGTNNIFIRTLYKLSQRQKQVINDTPDIFPDKKAHSSLGATTRIGETAFIRSFISRIGVSIKGFRWTRSSRPNSAVRYVWNLYEPEKKGAS